MKGFMAGVMLSMALVACGDKEQAAPKAAVDKLPAADIAAGKIIAERNCKGCHGVDGKGTAPAIPNLAAQRERYLLESIKEYKDGKRIHAALKDMTEHMTEADVRNVAAYYASLPPVAHTPQELALISPYEKGKAQAAACAGCHGEDGNSTKSGTPSLAGQQPHYLVAAIQEYHQGDRKTPAMSSVLRGASKMQLESLALYFASQTPASRGAAPFGDPAAGEPLTGVCGGCHGPRGISNDGATPTLAGQDPQYLVAAISGYGKSRRHEIMQAQIAKLSDKDIQNIAAYYTIQKAPPAAKGQGLVEQLAEKCNRCHANGSENAGMVVPKISGQDKNYLVMALRAYRDDRRESSAMHKMSLPFSDAIIDSIAALYAGEPPK